MILQGHRKICYRHDWLDLVLVQSSGLGSFLEKIFFFFKFQDSSEYIQAILLKPSNSSLLPRAQGPSFAESAKGAPVQVETVLKSIFEGLDGGGGGRSQYTAQVPPTRPSAHQTTPGGSPCWPARNDDKGTEIQGIRNLSHLGFLLISRYWGPCEFGEKSALQEVFHYLLSRPSV